MFLRYIKFSVIISSFFCRELSAEGLDLVTLLSGRWHTSLQSKNGYYWTVQLCFLRKKLILKY